MSQTTCPSCGEVGSGRFCSHCGTALNAQPAACRSCGNELPAGARFCNHCGEAAMAAPAKKARPRKGREAAPPPPPAEPVATGSNLPWIVAAIAAAALVILVLLPRFRGEGESRAEAPPFATGAPAAGAGAGGMGGVDLGSMTPREAADRLFNRVMQAEEAGDSGQMQMFLPMAISAYDMVPDIDLDGRYHLASLHLLAGNAEAARAEANTILSEAPNHLLGLFTAATAEQAMGNEEEARSLYQRFLASYDSEVGMDRREYQEHARILPSMRSQAQAAVGS